jgi:hypothetical protein
VGGAPFVVKLFSTKKAIQNKGGTTMSKDKVISLENPDVINGVKFIDGVDEETVERQRNAA